MKRAFFTIADSNNIRYYEMLKASLSKFHPNDELILFGDEQIKESGDPHFFYRSTPIIAKALFDKGYDEVCKLDSDLIVLGDLSHIWEGEYAVAVTNNSNPKEDQAYPVRLLDIHPFSYVNCGFVVMKSKAFVEHWFKLCFSEHFNNFQYREQDLLNLMVFFMGDQFGGPYKVKFLDNSDKWHNLVSKGYTTETKLVDNKVILPKGEQWPFDGDKQLVAYHYAGGNNNPMKGNYRIVFPEDVVKYIDTLVKP